MLELTLVDSNEKIYFHPHNIVAVHKSLTKAGTVIYTAAHVDPFLVNEDVIHVVMWMESNRLTAPKK